MRGPLLFGAGVAALTAAWLGPLPELARGSFTAHMALHMGVVAVAAPLLALGIASGPADPLPRFPRLFAPVPASLVELVVVWGWHAPALHQAARTTAAGFALEQGSFLAAGLFLWIAATGGGALRGAPRAGAGVVGLLLTSMHMTLLGALIGLGSRPLYEHAPGLGDQQLGGALMLLVGGVVYLAGGLWLVAALLRSRPSGLPLGAPVGEP